jgi:hypothetical protein
MALAYDTPLAGLASGRPGCGLICGAALGITFFALACPTLIRLGDALTFFLTRPIARLDLFGSDGGGHHSHSCHESPPPAGIVAMPLAGCRTTPAASSEAPGLHFISRQTR